MMEDMGAIMGVGFARGLGAVNRRVTRNIFASWLVTVPAAALLAVILFVLTRPFLLGLLKGVITSAGSGPAGPLPG